MLKNLFAPVTLFALLCFAVPASGQERAFDLPLPAKLRPALDAKTPQEALSFFTGIAFRPDGTIDEHGGYTLFSKPDSSFNDPGLNCSGFVLAASRLLLRKNIPLAVAARDRLGDSGPGAVLGRDWDFGWDVILNITEGMERSLLLPGGSSADPAAGSGQSPRGFDFHSPDTWRELSDRIRPNNLYLVSLNRRTTQRGYTLLHYHLGIIVRTSEKDFFLYHSIRKSGVVRENLGNEQNRARFLTTNANVGGTDKHIFVVEVPLPK